MNDVKYSVKVEHVGGAAQWTISTPGAVVELTYTDPEKIAAIAAELPQLMVETWLRYERGEVTPLEPTDVTKGLLE